MRFFITGGAGYVGSHCAKRLRESDHTLLIYDNLTTGHRQAVPDRELCIGDLADGAKLRDTMAEFKPDAVLHFAASIAVGESVERPLMYYRNNVINTIILLEVMEQLGIKKLVFSSSCAIHGVPPEVPITETMPAGPTNPYGRTKHILEEIFPDCSTAWGLAFAALRYFNAAGASADGSIGEDHDPETHLIPIVLQTALGRRAHVEIYGTDYDTADGTCIRDYIHVDDLAEAHSRALCALEGERQIRLNLGTGQGHSVRQVIDTARKVTARNINVVEGPRRPGDCPVLYADPALAAETLDWQAGITHLTDIVASAWQWHNRHPDGF